jgi:hypothetical protein
MMTINMQVETKLKHAAIIIDRLDYSLAAAIVEYAADCGLEALDFYVSHCEAGSAEAIPSRQFGDRHALRARDDVKVRFIDNSAAEPARMRLVSKLKSLAKQELDYEAFVETLVPSTPDLIIVVGDKLASRVIEEASYAELVFISDPELSSIKSAFEEFARRKRNFGS